MRTSHLPLVILTAALAACSSSSPGTASSPAKGIEAKVFADAEFGTMLGIAVAFPEDRVVTGARLLVGDQELRASTYPLDGTDPEPPPDPLPLAADVRVLVEARVPPDCDVPAGAPVFVVTSKTANGRSRDDRYSVSNGGEFRRQAENVCRLGPVLAVAGSTERPDGSFTVGLHVTNPGAPAEVVAREWTDGKTHWRAARAEVPSGGSVTLQIHGTGDGCSHEGPWEHGQVTLDGKVLDPPDEASADPC
jgi:hypothetical protein